MANRYKDILLDDNTGDLAIKGGDLFVGDSLDQEVGLILRLNQGELKSDPLLGPNLTSLLKGSDNERIKRKIKLNLELDGKQVGKINYDGQSVNIDASHR